MLQYAIGLYKKSFFAPGQWYDAPQAHQFPWMASVNKSEMWLVSQRICIDSFVAYIFICLHLWYLFQLGLPERGGHSSSLHN